MTWAIITGEYPPAPGGVGDYTRQVAESLARAGDLVHVFTVPDENDAAHGERTAPAADGDRVIVRALPDHFGFRSLAALSEAIDDLPQPRQILLQYVPHAFGWRAMNLPLCVWMLSRGRGAERVTVMFHEVSFPLRAGQQLTHNLLGVTNHAMAAMLGRAADRSIVTIPAWERLLRKLGARCPIDVAPVPSNMPLCVDCAEATDARRRYHGESETLIGTFGSFSPPVTAVLDQIVPSILAGDAKRKLLLIGRGSDEYRARLNAIEQTAATGACEPKETAAAMAACDVLVQPYPDGVSGRRSSTIAALALGIPVVTNAGQLTEPFWHSCGDAIALADSARDIPTVLARLLGDRARLETMRCAARRLYRARFALEHTIAVLRAAERRT